MKRTKRRPRLSALDWQEIFYALETKAHAIKKGHYNMPDDRPQEYAFRRKWSRHLRRIMRKIGPDGRRMHSQNP